MVRTNGLLVLNFGTDETVSDLDELMIEGVGQLQLIGDAVFTVDTANVAHSGGTIISNGGLKLTGLLQGDVRTEGNGFFELGAGGAEGSCQPPRAVPGPPREASRAASSMMAGLSSTGPTTMNYSAASRAAVFSTS